MDHHRLIPQPTVSNKLFCGWTPLIRREHYVMAGHSRPKDGVASARRCPAIHVLAQDEERSWMPGTSPGMTNSDTLRKAPR